MMHVFDLVELVQHAPAVGEVLLGLPGGVGVSLPLDQVLEAVTFLGGAPPQQDLPHHVLLLLAGAALLFLSGPVGCLARAVQRMGGALGASSQLETVPAASGVGAGLRPAPVAAGRVVPALVGPLPVALLPLFHSGRPLLLIRWGIAERLSPGLAIRARPAAVLFRA